MVMDETEPEFCRIVRSIEFAGMLGAPLIVVHALRLMPEDRTEDLREEQDRTLELNLRWYRTLQPYAEKAGIRIAVENLAVRGSDQIYSPRLLEDARSYAEILDQLDPDWFTGCFDVGHANLSMGDPAAFIREVGKYIHFLHIHDNDGHANLSMGDPASFIREAGKYIHHLHVHDNDGHRDLHLMPAFGKLEGHGSNNAFSIPWKDVALALRDVRYDGPFNYECSTSFAACGKDLLPEAMALSAKAALNAVRFMEGEVCE